MTDSGAQARSWLIEQGLLSLDDAVVATAQEKTAEELRDRLADRADWVGEIYKTTQRNRKG